MTNPEIDVCGNKKWRNSNGELHRDGGPALEMINGHTAWFQNGKEHREDGPAVHYVNGTELWYLNGKMIT
jgi:hypothetical protein